MIPFLEYIPKKNCFEKKIVFKIIHTTTPILQYFIVKYLKYVQLFLFDNCCIECAESNFNDK